MIIFLADGRFGNQLFQYMFLKSVKKENEKIIVSGFDDLVEVFEVNDIINIRKKNKYVRFLMYKILQKLLNYLSNKNFISSIEIKRQIILHKYTRETIQWQEKNGLMDNIKFVKPGFFQSEVFFDRKLTTNLCIKKRYLDGAKKILNSIPRNTYKVFVHIRRGDYKNYTVYGKSTLLPLRYFKRQIKWFQKNKKNVFFIFLSDEPEWINNEFVDIHNKIISNANHFGIDFVIMTKCQGAILSPSSFGWWGSYLMENRDIVFAPMYWLGFNSNIEYQEAATPSYAINVRIREGDKK